MFVRKKDLIKVVQEAFTDREVQKILAKQRQSAGSLSPQAAKYVQSLEGALQQAGSTSQMSARELAGAFGQGEPGAEGPPPSGKEKVSNTPGSEPKAVPPKKEPSPDYHQVFGQDKDPTKPSDQPPQPGQPPVGDPEKASADLRGLYDPKAEREAEKAAAEFGSTLEPGQPSPAVSDLPPEDLPPEELPPEAHPPGSAEEYLSRIARGEPSPLELPKEPGMFQQAASGLSRAGTSLADYYSQMMPAPQIPQSPAPQPSQPSPPTYSGPPMPAMPQTQQAVQQAMASQSGLAPTMQSLAYQPTPEELAQQLATPYRQEGVEKEFEKNVRLPSMKEVFIGRG